MIVGGLIFSQLVTLFITPVIYPRLEWFQEHVLDRVPILRSTHRHADDSGQILPAPAGATGNESLVYKNGDHFRQTGA